MITWAELLHQELAASASDARAYLQDALAENNPGVLLLAVKHVIEARGGLEGLGLSLTEMTAQATVLGRHVQLEPLQRAA